MKGEKRCTPFLAWLSVVLLVLLSPIYIIKNVSALEFLEGSTAELTSGYVTTGLTPNLTRYNLSLSGGNLSSSNLPSDSSITHIEFNFSSSVSTPYLISFSIQYNQQGQGSNYLEYFGLQSSMSNILSEQCVDTDSGNISFPYVGNTVYYPRTITCYYLAYSNNSTQTFASPFDTRIIRAVKGSSSSGNSAPLYITISKPFIRHISWNGLTDDDRTWLEEHMPTGSSTSDIESAIESAREDEKEEYEEQQEDVDSGADDAGEEAEEATSTLIETGRSIIETIRDTPATNCVIRINTGHFDTGNLNLCNVPQQIRTIISTVITIPVTLAALHIGYTVVMLYLNTVRKEQE